MTFRFLAVEFGDSGDRAQMQPRTPVGTRSTSESTSDFGTASLARADGESTFERVPATSPQVPD